MTIEPMTLGKRRSSAIAFAVALVPAVTAPLVPGQPLMPSPSPVVDGEAAVRLPSTAEDHLTLAKEYQARAGERRREADLHRRMLAAHERFAAEVAAQPTPPPRRGKTFPSRRRTPSKDPVAEYRAHCQGYIRGAVIMVDEAERLAAFHRTRAADLRKAGHP